MSTFALVPDQISSNSGAFYEWTAFQTEGSDILAGLLNPNGGLAASNYPFVTGGVNAPPPPFTVNSADNLLRLGFSLGGNIISLNGGAAISFNSLPAGFRILTVTIGIWAENDASDPTTHFTLQYASMGEESSALGFNSVSFPYPGTLPIQNLLNWWNNGIGIRLNNTTSGQKTSRILSRLAIGGNYDLNSWQITSITPSPIRTDLTPVSIHLNGTNLQNMPSPPNINIQYTNADGGTSTVDIPDSQVTLVNDTLVVIVVTIAQVTPPPNVLLNYNGTATLFSGTVPLGSVTILYATGSGMYQFIPNQRHDIYYDRTQSPVGTVNVAIPTPFGETGFIGG